MVWNSTKYTFESVLRSVSGDSKSSTRGWRLGIRGLRLSIGIFGGLSVPQTKPTMGPPTVPEPWIQDNVRKRSSVIAPSAHTTTYSERAALSLRKSAESTIEIIPVAFSMGHAIADAGLPTAKIKVTCVVTVSSARTKKSGLSKNLTDGASPLAGRVTRMGTRDQRARHSMTAVAKTSVAEADEVEVAPNRVGERLACSVSATQMTPPLASSFPPFLFGPLSQSIGKQTSVVATANA